MNKTKKGNYYRLKTKKWLEKDGYLVENLEKSQRIWTEKGVIFVRRDIWGCDLIAKNREDLIFIQVKTNKGDASKGIKEINKTIWPAFVKKWVVIWPYKGKEPEIIET